VFTFSGLVHDCGILGLRLLYTPAHRVVDTRNMFRLTPFFALQPFALVGEAVLKKIYRAWKDKKGQRTPETANDIPSWMIFLERAVGFTLTWVWLGWTAVYFVDGLTKEGMFSRAERHPKFPSLIGGLIWGKYMH
jgi:hypothetical protein